MIYDMTIIKQKIADYIKDAPIVKIGKKRYIKLYAGYDTETTRINKRSYIYHFQLGINSECFGFRTWEDFLSILDHMHMCIHRGHRKSKKLPTLLIWVANLSFEFQFLKDRKEFEVFATAPRQPLSAKYGAIEFREALKISGSNLDHLARTFCTTRKLVGDLDYTKIRNSSTPLTPQEIKYCENDVIILCEFAQYIFKNAPIWGTVPYTFTGILRRECKEAAKKLKGWNYTIRERYFTEQEYNVYMHYLYRGAFVHANRAYAGYILQGDTEVCSYDKKSSYPAQMMQQLYPTSKFKEVPEFKEYYIKKYCCILDVVFYNINQTSYHSIESAHKCIDVLGGQWDNGRLMRAEAVHVLLTEVDYEVYKTFYRWDHMKVLSCKIAYKGQLPRFLIDKVLKYFDLKESTPKDTTEYFISKQRVNSFYGMCCSRHHFRENIYKAGEWTTQAAENRDGTIKTFDDFIKDDFLLPAYGIWITAYARADLLLKAVWPNRHYVVYCDTDSVYFCNGFDVTKLLDHNKYLEDINLKGRQANYPRLGCYEFEGRYKRFKTLGAKRYVKEYYREDMPKHRYKITDIKKGIRHYDRHYYLSLNKVNQTIAGLGKNVLLEYCNKTHKDVFEVFDNSMDINSIFTQKLTTHYEDKPHSNIVNGELMQELSSVSLMPSDFAIHMSKEYLLLLATVKKGRQRRE